MKKIFKRLVITILLFSFLANIAFGSGSYFLFKKLEEKNAEIDSIKSKRIYDVENIISNPAKSELENYRSIPKKPKDVSELFVSGWIPDWDIPNGFETFKDQSDAFNSMSPVWFWVNEDGTLKETPDMNDPEIIKFAKDNDIELIPTITLFDPEIYTKILNDEAKFNLHIKQILDQIKDNNYDGIDLDYESTYLKDKEKFFDMLEKLSLEIAKLDKKFVFTVLPKWGDEVIYKGLPETRAVQDYKRIADLVDEFRIMTYEYTGRSSAYYGPVAPLPWMEDTIRYAIYKGVPREKIMLGIHTYAYNYTDRPIIPKFDYYPVFAPTDPNGLEDALALFPSDVVEIFKEVNEEIRFDDYWGEAVASYISPNSGLKRYIVYPDQKAIDLRKKLAADYGLKGVVYWRIGSDGELRY